MMKIDHDHDRCHRHVVRLVQLIDWSLQVLHVHVCVYVYVEAMCLMYEMKLMQMRMQIYTASSMFD